MGYAIAAEAAALGAEVVLVSGPTQLPPPDGVTIVSIETTEQMYRAVKTHFKKADCLIMAAAPADYSVKKPAAQKIKKTGETLTLELSPTVDILKKVAATKRTNQIVVGFALETEIGIANARAKLNSKNLDLIVLNNPNDTSAAFDHDTNQVTLIAPNRTPDAWPLMSKKEVSTRLLARLAKML